MHYARDNERRREKRSSAVRAVRYRPGGEPGGALSRCGLTRNASKSGFCMYTGHAFRQGAVLEVGLPRSGPRQATVRWCRRKVQSHLYVLGLSFD